jgi:hypothetical protein
MLVNYLAWRKKFPDEKCPHSQKRWICSTWLVSPSLGVEKMSFSTEDCCLV